MDYLLIDIGGSAIKYAVCDEELQLRQKGKAEVYQQRPKEELYERLGKIVDSLKTPVAGIAISMPGIINAKEGYCYRSSMLEDGDFPIAKELTERFGLPVSVINDGYSAGLAELGYGNMQDVQNGAVLVLGTGIGGALILNHELYTGSDHSAANMSFIYSNIEKPEDMRTMFAFQNGIGGLKNAIAEKGGPEDTDGIKAFRLIKEGNEQVREGLELFCDRLAFQIYNLQAILDLDRILIGGGISAEPTLIDYIRSAVDRRWQTTLIKLKKPEIEYCRFNNDANLYGALYNWKRIYNR